jgi:putative mRNA 3-end processing factor
VARRPRAAPVPPVTWRDGVHLTGTPIWCDARRRRDVCFVSSADRIVRAGHGQLIGTPLTISMIAGRDSGHLAVPVRRPFTLGTLRLELIPSGRALGAAALHVDTGMRTALYAGAIRTVHATEAAEVRASDAVVVAAPIGEPHHKLAPIAEVAERVIEWVRAQLAANNAPVLVVDTALDGLEVAAQLVAANLPVVGSKSLRDAAELVGDTAPAMRAASKEPAVIVRAEPDRIKASSTSSVAALVSARAVDPRLTGQGYAATFAWPFVASRAQLLGWIEQARAKQVFVTGACAESIVASLGARASVLGPPQQMALFSS